MALFRRIFYKTPPDRLVEISERVYAFDCCFSGDVMGEDEYKLYLGGIVTQLQDHFPDASFLVFNFKEGDQPSQISTILSQYDMTVMDYPNHYQTVPLIHLEMIHHFLRSSESWLSMEGQHNVLLMHCERGGWPVLAFMLSGLLLYRKQYQGEQKTLEMVYKQAPVELLHLLSPLNPQPSQLRYLQYISRRDLGSDWPPSETPLLLDCLILRDLPYFEGRKGCRPVLRVYGQDPKDRANRSPIVLFSTPKKHTRLYQQEECVLVKLDVQCCVQGDVVLECIHLHDDLMHEEMVFRIMFHTSFVRSNVLIIHRDDMDILWDAKDQFPKEFKAEVLCSGNDSTSEEFYEVEEIFSDVIVSPDHKTDSDDFVAVDDSEDTSVLHSSQVAVSPPPPPLAYNPLGHPQASQFPSPPPPPPPLPPPFVYPRRRKSKSKSPPPRPDPATRGGAPILPPPPGPKGLGPPPPPPPLPPPFVYPRRRKSKSKSPPPRPDPATCGGAPILPPPLGPKGLGLPPPPPPPSPPFVYPSRRKSKSKSPPPRPDPATRGGAPILLPPLGPKGLGPPPPPPPPPPFVYPRRRKSKSKSPPPRPDPRTRRGAPILPPPPGPTGLGPPPPPPPSGARGSAVGLKSAGRGCGIRRPMYGAPPPPYPQMFGLGGPPPPPPIPGVREHGAPPPAPPL